MKTIRLLHFVEDSQVDPIQEYVIFTEDLSSDAEDYRSPGYVLSSDTRHELELPAMFPIEEELKKS